MTAISRRPPIKPSFFQSRTGRVALAIIVALFAAMLLAFDSRATWTPDGFVYAQMMLEDRGFPSDQAHAVALKFYLTTPVGRSSRYRPYFLDERRGMFTSEAKPFSARVLYPWLAAVLYPVRGFAALLDVSRVAFVLAGLAMFWLLLSLARPVVAAVGAVLFLIAPEIRFLGDAALTDMAAILFLVVTLSLMTFYVRDRCFVWIFLAALASIAVSLCRPMPYIPFGAAIVLGIWAVWLRRSQSLRDAVVLLACAVIGLAAYGGSSFVTHTPSLGEHLHWLWQHALDGWIYASSRSLDAADRSSFATWYARELLWTCKAFAATLLYEIYPVIVIALSLLGLATIRRNPEMPVLLGAGMAALLGIAANPVGPELPRLVIAPAIPAVISGLVALADRTKWLRMLDSNQRPSD